MIVFIDLFNRNLNELNLPSGAYIQRTEHTLCEHCFYRRNNVSCRIHIETSALFAHSFARAPSETISLIVESESMSYLKSKERTRKNWIRNPFVQFAKDCVINIPFHCLYLSFAALFRTDCFNNLLKTIQIIRTRRACRKLQQMEFFSAVCFFFGALNRGKSNEMQTSATFHGNLHNEFILLFFCFFNLHRNFPSSIFLIYS